MKLRASFLWLLLIVSVFPAFAQESGTARRLRFFMDQASYRYDESGSLLDFYVSFEAKNLPFAQSATGVWEAQVPFRWMLRKRVVVGGQVTNEVVKQDAMRLSFAISDTASVTRNSVFTEKFMELVQPGEYELVGKVLADPTKGIAENEIVKQISVRNYKGDARMELSDLLLASQIEVQAPENDPFRKNGLSVRPNVGRLFGNGANRLYFYIEAYHVDRIKVDPASTTYTVLTYISNANAAVPLPNFQSKTTRKLVQDDVLMGSYDIAQLPSGTYYLRVALLNENNEASGEQSVRFHVYNPNVVVQQVQVDPEEEFLSSPYYNMTEAEVSQELEYVEVIISMTEERQIRNLKTLEAKRRWIYDFWKMHDPNPNTLVNEYRNEYYELIRIANERFSNKFMKGWKTDRGRTILKYGMPSSTEPHLYDREYVPYEYWEYQNIPGEGRAEFVFADIGGFKEYELIHATVTGAVKNDNWRAKLRRSN